MKKKIEQGTIDLEPKWEDIISMVISGHVKAKDIEKDLYNLAKIGDLVRQAQKKEEDITFNFKKGN